MSLSAAAGFTRRFGIGMRAGADLIALLRAEAKQGSARQRDAINGLANDAGRGDQLHKSMERRSGFFPPLMISMTKVGEATGRLERALLSLADHYDQQVQLRRQFISSITLPMLQLIVGLGVVSLLIWLLGILTPPTGGEMTDILGLGLRGFSGVLWFWTYIAIVSGVIGAIYYAFSRNIAGIQNLIPLIYMIPLLGKSIQTITLSRFCWTLSLALDAGLDPIGSIDLALDSTDSDFYRTGKPKAESAIRGGATLAGALESTSLFPEDFISRVEVAELSGTDAESINLLAAEYDERAKLAMRAIAKFSSGIVWLSMLAILLFFIIRLLTTILGAYSSALEGI